MSSSSESMQQDESGGQIPIRRATPGVGRKPGSTQRVYSQSELMAAFNVLLQTCPQNPSGIDSLRAIKMEMQKVSGSERTESAIQTLVKGKLRKFVPEFFHRKFRDSKPTPREAMFLREYMKGSSWVDTVLRKDKTPKSIGQVAEAGPSHQGGKSISFFPVQTSTPSKGCPSNQESSCSTSLMPEPVTEQTVQNLVELVVAKKLEVLKSEIKGYIRESIQEAAVTHNEENIRESIQEAAVTHNEEYIRESIQEAAFTHNEENIPRSIEDEPAQSALLLSSDAPTTSLMQDSSDALHSNAVDQMEEVKSFKDSGLFAKISTVTLIKIFESSAEDDGKNRPFKVMEEDGTLTTVHEKALALGDWTSGAQVNLQEGLVTLVEEEEGVKRQDILSVSRGKPSLGPVIVDPPTGHKKFQRARMTVNGVTVVGLLKRHD